MGEHKYYVVEGKAYFKVQVVVLASQLQIENILLKNTHLFKTGLSDHHLSVYARMKTTFEKSQPKKLIYRKYMKFFNGAFITDFVEIIEAKKYCIQIYRIINKNGNNKTQMLKSNYISAFLPSHLSGYENLFTKRQ